MRRRNRRRVPNVVEPELRTIVEVAPMADNQTMEELLQAPTEGESSSKTDERIDKLADQISTLVEIVSKKVVTPATVKAVEESCVTCSGPHAYYNYPNTDSNQSNVCAAMGTYNQVAPPNRLTIATAKKLTLRVGDEELIFNVESASKHPQKHSDNSIHKVDILDTTCDDHVYEVLNFQKSINATSGNPTFSSDPMVESLSPFLTSFGDSDFLLEETNTFLSLDDSIPPGIDNGTYNL
ncbi:hypothetical protein Tco_0098429 [Tanacetum coccineum]